jgi:hypothetical protein
LPAVSFVVSRITEIDFKKAKNSKFWLLLSVFLIFIFCCKKSVEPIPPVYYKNVFNSFVNGYSDVYIMDADGTESTLLPYYSTGGAFSPNSQLMGLEFFIFSIS